jgi:hypothetical protein
MKEVIHLGKSSIFFISVLIVISLLSGCAQKEAQTPANDGDATKSVTAQSADQEMVDCSKTDDPSCFINRMNACLPVTTNMIGSDGTTAIEITILGQVNETCHFQRKLNDVLNLDCYFPKGTMNMDTLDQTFGNDKGLQKVVDDNCRSPGW